MTETISYSVKSGDMDVESIVFDIGEDSISFWTPARYEGNLILDSAVQIDLIYSVQSNDGEVYLSKTETILIAIEESSTGFCIPDLPGPTPVIYDVTMLRDDDPSQLILLSQSRNECSDTIFAVEETSGVESTSSHF